MARVRQDAYADLASELGIATHYINESSIPKVLEDLAQLPEPTLQQLSSIIATHAAPSSSADLTTPIKGAVRTYLDSVFDPKKHDLEAILADLQKTSESTVVDETVAKWAGAQLALMKQRSPTALKVALEGIKRAHEVKKLDAVLKNGELDTTPSRRWS